MTTHRLLCGLTFGSILLAGCVAAPQSPPGADLAREKLTRLQSDPALANKAPAALEVAEEAVRLAEQPLTTSDEDQSLGAHRVYVADHQVEIAMAKAATRHAQDQRAQLAEQRAQTRLDARTREADRARDDADRARDDADRARSDADRIASEGEAARAVSEAEAAKLQRQIADLKAEATDRGLVLTLGDLLFEFDSSDLKTGVTSNLRRLVAFLKEYPTRNVAIEGHTDNVGSEDYNRALSQRRADSVRSYLVQEGIGAQRLSATGLGQSQPLVSNDSDSGRQRNRRVEIIIDNPPVASASAYVQ